MRVLVVDDDSVVRIVCRGVLEAQGIEGIEHDSAFATGSLVIREEPDVILMDLEMPGLRGDQVVETLKKCGNESYRPLIVFHSGRDIDELKQLAAETGADGAIEKASSPDEFRIAFSRLMYKLGVPMRRAAR